MKKNISADVWDWGGDRGVWTPSASLGPPTASGGNEAVVFLDDPGKFTCMEGGCSQRAMMGTHAGRVSRARLFGLVSIRL